MARPPAVPVPAVRNPYAGKGLAVTVALLLRAPSPARLVDVAAAAQASPTLVTRVVRSLRTAGLVTGELRQGRDAAVVATRDLFWETAAHWPPPVVSVQGGSMPTHLPAGGAALARERFGRVAIGAPCFYVRHAADLDEVLSLTGGALVSDAVAEWQLAVVDFPFEPGPLPDVALALELGRTPRGREELEAVSGPLLTGWAAGR